MSSPIDLRSDTVTRPTEAMIQAMSAASLGDDSRDGDDDVKALETLAAERLGKEAALFMPSGTMANLVAVMTHVPRGGEVLLDAGAHILNSELGGIAAVAGAMHRPISAQRGRMDLDELARSIRPASRTTPGTALVCMETSHNRAGGAVLPLEYMRAVHALARDAGVPVHTDGARVFNAAAALKLSVSQIAQHTDSIGFCISKGLSAPVGSLLCGTRPFIERARAFRRMVGGNLRQAGPLAAAGSLAIRTMGDRLEEDHTSAKRLAQGLNRLDGRLVDPATVETNLVKVALPSQTMNAARFSEAMGQLGVRVSPCDTYALRFVTHRHITANDIDRALDAFKMVWQSTQTTQGGNGTLTAEVH